MDGNATTPMARLKAEIAGALAEEKGRLCAEIGARLDCSGGAASANGARGRIPGLPGTLLVNCGRNGEPSARVGRGVNGLAHYFWIPAVYRDGGLERSYALSLCREDIDVRTGNVHADFTRLQMTRLGNDGPEVGGQANPAPARIGGGWRLDYLADASFPRAARCCPGATVDADERPWGHGGFEGRVPVLDMADPAYDPGAAAGFFLELVARDVRSGEGE